MNRRDALRNLLSLPLVGLAARAGAAPATTTLAAPYGGTGFVAGDILFAGGPITTEKLAVNYVAADKITMGSIGALPRWHRTYANELERVRTGDADHVLTMSGDLPEWVQ